MKPHEVYDITTHNLWNSLQITETESESYTKVLIEKYPGLVRLVLWSLVPLSHIEIDQSLDISVPLFATCLL